MRTSVWTSVIKAWALAGLLSGSAWCQNSIGFGVSGGVGYWGYDANSSLEIQPDRRLKPWEIFADVSTQHTTIGTESRSNQIIGGLSHAMNDNWEFNGRLTYWKDTLNDLHYVGPTVGFTFVWNKEGEPIPPEFSLARPSENDLSATAPPPPDEILAVSLSSDFFFYATEVRTSSLTFTLFGRHFTVPPRQGTAHVNQIHPNVIIEAPLWEFRITPYLMAGHFFYSHDPAEIEDLAGRPIFAASANQLNGLIAGFLNNNGEAGVRLIGPLHLQFSARLGADQLATDNTWATLQGLAVARKFWNCVRMKVDWARSIQSGISSDVWGGTVTYEF